MRIFVSHNFFNDHVNSIFQGQWKKIKFLKNANCMKFVLFMAALSALIYIKFEAEQSVFSVSHELGKPIR